MPTRPVSAMLFACLLAGGCASFGPASRLAMDNALSEAPAEAAVAKPVTATAAAPATPIGPPPEVTEQEAMAAVAPTLAEIAAADPELHAEVLEQLGGTRPGLWSLAVQRAQHTLEYRQQLAAKSAPQPATTAAKPAPSPVVQASATVDQDERAAPEAPMPHVVGSKPVAPVIDNSHYHVASASTAEVMAPTYPSTGPAEEETTEPEEPKGWRDHLASAIATFKKTESTKPRSRAEAEDQVRLRLLRLAAGDADGAASAPPGLSSAEQGYWSNQLWAMATLLDSEGGGRQSKIDAASRRQEEASAKLRAMGDLQVRNFAACEAVYGYGAYEPTRDARYTPGEQVVLYAEIDNYQSDATAEGYHTLVTSSYRLVADNGDEVLAGDFPEVDDLCLTRRRDFHIRYGVTLPADLAPGDYRLELTVTDRLAEKIGHSELALRVAAR